MANELDRARWRPANAPTKPPSRMEVTAEIQAILFASAGFFAGTSIDWVTRWKGERDGCGCTAQHSARSSAGLSSLRCDMHTEATAQGPDGSGTEAIVPGLVICGPGGCRFTPGTAMHLNCVWGFLGTLTPTFSMDKSVAVMHIDRFDASRLLLRDARNLGSWLLYEICAFMCSQLPHVAVLRFTLSRPLDGLGTASEQVLMRLKALDTIGAEVSGFSVRGASMHVIEGLWRPSTENFKRLAAALTDHRSALRLAPMQAITETKGSALGMSLRERLDTVRRLVVG